MSRMLNLRLAFGQFGAICSTNQARDGHIAKGWIMALGRAGKGPRVIASGILSKITPRTYAANDKNNELQRVGEVYAIDYTLKLDDGAEIYVRAWDRGDGPSELDVMARVGELLTVWVEIVKGEARYGDSFEFDRMVSPSDLDLIHSAQLASAK